MPNRTMSPIHAGLMNLSRAARGESLLDIPEREEEKLDPLDDPSSPQSQSARRVFAGTKAGQRVVQSMGAGWERTPARALPGGASLISLMAAESNERNSGARQPASPGFVDLVKQTPYGQRMVAKKPDIFDNLTDDELKAAMRLEPDAKPLAEQDDPKSAASALARLNAPAPVQEKIRELDRPQKGKLYDPGEDPAPLIPSEQISANAIEDMRGKAEKETNTARGASMDLRKEFNALPIVKNFNEVDAAYGKVKAAASEPSAAGDMALIFGFMKLLDPGSSVREGEYASAQNAAGVPDRVRSQYNSILTGQKLAPEQRKDFLIQAQKQYGIHVGQYSKQAARYRDLAAKNGADPDDVAPLLGGVDVAPPATPSRATSNKPPPPSTPDIPAANSANTKTVNGKTYRKTAAGWELVR